MPTSYFIAPRLGDYPTPAGSDTTKTCSRCQHAVMIGEPERIGANPILCTTCLQERVGAPKLAYERAAYNQAALIGQTPSEYPKDQPGQPAQCVRCKATIILNPKGLEMFPKAKAVCQTCMRALLASGQGTFTGANPPEGPTQ